MLQQDTMANNGSEKNLNSQRSPRIHPRRPPANKSVSLLHSPKGSRRHGPGQTAHQLLPMFARNQRSLGESSNGDKWFEASNNNPTGSGDLIENDPPFFIRNSSSSETPSDAVLHKSNPLLHADDLLRVQNADSGSDDFRSVIDDLTIENKKLKRRLRKYEKLHDAHLQSEKLFEVRVHGLTPAKKRELEATLRSFALGLEDTPQPSSSANGTSSYASRLNKEPTTSSLTSTRLADSAYASMSGGKGSVPSGQGSSSNGMHGQGMSTHNIRSYLHEIPAGLLPRPFPVMTEKAKRKVVVRRLEQLFAGKGATKDGHQQPLQQEEVAQSAARADRIDAGEDRAEGAREARIVPTNQIDAPEGCHETMQERADSQSGIPGRIASGKNTPGQRPTRPLDLDPARAQVPSENIQYMRHLGFSPSDIDTSIASADDHGWVYLNVLTNMAQLHDINVTTEFVKNAVAIHSKKLELSQDGRKARWKGGSNMTRTSSDGSPIRSQSDFSKQLNSDRKQNSGGQNSSVEAPTAASHVDKANKLSYIPLFAHQEESLDERSSDANVSGWSSPAAEEIQGHLSSRYLPAKKRKDGSGPIIFYHNTNFCTDLSGDSRVQLNSPHTGSVFSSTSLQTIGLSQDTSASTKLTGIGETKGPLSLPMTIAADSMDVESNDGDVLKGFSKPPSLSNTPSEESADPVDFEASGIGGVQPSDNFSITVKRRRKACSRIGCSTSAVNGTRLYPSRILNLLGNGNNGVAHRPDPRRSFNAEVISSKSKDLPASSLPPASFYSILDADSEDSDANDSDMSDSDIGTTHMNHLFPSSNSGQRNWMPMDTDSEEFSVMETSADDQESDDDSIDMLAHARLADPITVRAQEREYDSNIAERLAEEIPAGSSAATAGGGSGYNSPVMVRNVEKNNNSKTSDMPPPSANPLKRTRFSDGMDLITKGRAAKSPRFE
ncbi:hypothetical protein EJ08DRAFT_86234 [Tothia fuscella]|uniref:Frequency clock protein n=1 Tax=Tothia fuscella TaxID=1048955 RepID=A0A9P4NE94_9PEZI|nr:hypothetical protein EJ08DRAFT_86234 [Tothia fuscella]